MWVLSPVHSDSYQYIMIETALCLKGMNVVSVTAHDCMSGHKNTDLCLAHPRQSVQTHLVHENRLQVDIAVNMLIWSMWENNTAGLSTSWCTTDESEAFKVKAG